MEWQADLKHVKESKRELWHLTKKNIQYEGLMNIRYGESSASAYFSFDEKNLFQSFKKNISFSRMFGHDVHLFWAAFAISVMSCTIAFHLDGFPYVAWKRHI